jgi:hypothetical protein
MKKCTYCGKEYSDEATFCPNDASPLENVSSNQPSRPAAKSASSGNLSELPLHVRRRPAILNHQQNWLTISKEGLALHDNHPPLFFLWNEIARISLLGTRTQSLIFGHTTWGSILIELNGFEASPVVVSTQGSERNPKEVFEIIKASCNNYRNGKSVPPLDRVFPKLALALQHLPMKISFPKAASRNGLVMGLVIFLLLYLGPVVAVIFFDKQYRLSHGLSFFAYLFKSLYSTLPTLGLFGMLGFGMIILYGRRLANRDPVLILTEDGFTYRRGWKHFSIAAHQITDFQFRLGSRQMTVAWRDHRKLSTRLKLRGLDHAPNEIYYMLKHLKDCHWLGKKVQC